MKGGYGYRKLLHHVFLALAVGGCFVLLLAVVFRERDSQSVDSFFRYYGILAGVVASVLLHSLFSPVRFRFTFADALVLGFLLWSLVLCLWKEPLAESCAGMLFLPGVAYLCFRRALESHRRASLALCVAVVITGLAEAVLGLCQLYGYAAPGHMLFRITGTFFNPGPFSGYLALVFPLALFLALKYQGCLRPRRHPAGWVLSLVSWVSLLAVCLIVMVLPAGMSRSGWLGAFAGGVWVLGAHYRWREHLWALYHRSRRLFFVLLGGALLLLGLAGWGMYALKPDSADGRLLTWKVSSQVVGQHPLTGVGPGHFSGAYGAAQAAYFATGGTERERWVAGTPEYAFNEYVQVAVETGIPGLFLFLLALFLGLWRLRHSAGLFGVLLSLTVFAGTSYPLSILPFMIVLVFVLAHAGAGRRGFAVPRPFTSVGLLLLLVLLVWGWQRREAVREAQQDWREVSGSGVLTAYDGLYPLLHDDVFFLFDYGRLLAGSDSLARSNEVFERALAFRGDPMLCNLMGKNFMEAKRYSEAECWFEKAACMAPGRLYPHYLLARMYARTGQREKALSKAELILATQPKIPSTATREMQDEMQVLRDSLRHAEVR